MNVLCYDQQWKDFQLSNEYILKNEIDDQHGPIQEIFVNFTFDVCMAACVTAIATINSCSMKGMENTCSKIT